jgi:regulator of replication initiation timing
MTPETMPTDEQENLIAPTESNVRYWTQMVMDVTEQEGWSDKDIAKVIRELLEKDTHYAAVNKSVDAMTVHFRQEKEVMDETIAQLKKEIAGLEDANAGLVKRFCVLRKEQDCADAFIDKQEEEIKTLRNATSAHAGAVEVPIPSVEELNHIYWDTGTNAGGQPDVRHKLGISAVREAIIAYYKGVIFQARDANARCANAMEDKAKAEAERDEAKMATGHTKSKVQRLVEQCDSLRVENEALKAKLAEATGIMQRALDGTKELRLLASTWEKRYDEQTATAAKALEQRDTALAQLAKRQWVSFEQHMPDKTDGNHDGNVLWAHIDGRTVVGNWNHGGPNAKPQGWYWMPHPPTQAPATVETCPTCGSDDKEFRACPFHNTTLCADSWHDKPTPDPLAEVKAAFARGEKIQFKDKQATEAAPWIDTFDPQWNASCTYRIAPAPAWVPKYAVGDWVTTKDQPDPEWKRRVRNVDTLTKVYRLESKDGITLFGAWIESDLTPYTWQLPPGDWHRVDWTEDMLPRGYRPLLRSEKPNHDSEIYIAGYWCPSHAYAWSANNHARTRRPLPSPLRVEMPKIKTRFINPPIPIRNFDWEATRDGYDKGDPIGFGRTEELAKADLLEQEEAR